MRRIVSALILLLLLLPGTASLAQQATSDGPVYIVKAGDSLWGIASRFGVSLSDLQKANGIADPNQLNVGQRLVIPGLAGIQGILVTTEAPYGETLLSLSRRYQTPTDILIRLNHLTSPSEIYAGSTLVIPEQTEMITSTQRLQILPGQSLLELAAAHRVNPWSLINENNLTNATEGLPGDVLLLANSSSQGAAKTEPGALPPMIKGIELKPPNLLQGKVAIIRINLSPGVNVNGSFMGHELHFMEESPGNMVALQGVHAMADPGIYPLVISTTLADRTVLPFSQTVLVQAVDYPYDQPLTVDPATIDPAITGPEDAQWSALALPVTTQKNWSEVFKFPSPLPVDYCLRTNECWSSRYGNRRSYNGGPYIYFHTGLDIVGKIGTEIYAAAGGRVVFTGPLTVRGNATMIDHGWGVYTGYLHQSQILVKVGDQVRAGQLIGLVGNTGRVEGPHLHWEVWVGGVQVDPLDWLKQVYP